MKINTTGFMQFIKRIAFAIMLSAIITTIAMLLIEYRILPKDKWSGTFGSFDNINEITFFWLFFFISGLIIMLIIIPLKDQFLTGLDFICPNCEDVQTVNKKKTSVLCKKCGIQLVPLRGFYNRKKKDKKSQIKT